MDVDPQIDEQGTTVSQIYPLPNQVQNPAGGYSYPTPDHGRVHRFLCLGNELKYYRAGQQHSKFSRSEVQAIDRLIYGGKGQEVVHLIRMASITGQACKQGPVLYALAVCARSSSRQTKIDAYNILNEVCRIPTHLFQFIRYCEEMSSNETGWGRAHRKAVSEWYKSFISKDPEAWNHPIRLAYLVTKYKRRYGYSHRDVIRLAHVKARTKSARIVIQHILGKEIENPDSEESRKVLNFLVAAREAKKCRFPEDEEKLCELIATFRLSREHVPNRFLRGSLKVWCVLTRDMPMTALIRNLSKISSLDWGNDTKAIDFFLELIEVKMADHEGLRKSGIHPLQLLVALKHYNMGHGYNGRLKWTVNPRISCALENAFYNCPAVIPSKNRRYLMAVSVGESMQMPICRSTIKASEAAAAMVLSTLKIKNTNVEAIMFTNSLEDACIANITNEDTLETIEQKIFQIPRETGQRSIRQDLSVPFKWAAARKERFDAIIIFTDSITSCGHIHPAEAVKQYSKYMAVPNYKLVVVSMTSDRFTIAPPEDTNSLDVVGFDIHTPGIIMKFLDDYQGSSHHGQLLQDDEENIIDLH